MPPKRKRSTTPKYRAVRASKKRKVIRRRFIRRTRRKTYAPDPTVVRLNPVGARPVRASKGTILIAPFGPSTVGSTGVSIQLSTAAVLVQRNFTFDPSNTYGNFSGTINSVSQTLGPHFATSWGALTGLYKYYRVDRITINFRYDDLGSADTCSPTVYMRYHDGEFNTDTPSPTIIASERGWISKKFDASNSTFKYSFIPLVQNLTLGSSGGAFVDTGKSARRMRWTSVFKPVEIYGFRLYLNWPVNSAADLNSFINMDVVYHMSFKEQA